MAGSAYYTIPNKLRLLQVDTTVSSTNILLHNGNNEVVEQTPSDLLAVLIGIGAGTVTSVAASGGTTGLSFSGSPITSSGTLTLAGTLITSNGGTGLSTWTQGDIPYYTSGTALSKLAKSVTANQFLSNSGASNAPAWSTITASMIGSGAALSRTNDTNVTLTLGGSPTTSLLAATSLTLGWTGQLGLSRGGTNADLSATGGTSQYLKQSSAGAAITVGTIPASDIASGAALTRVDDTNVTLTLGGSPSTSLLAATSLTLGWSGQLSLARGGTNKNITAVAGAVVWTDSDSMELTSAGTTGQALISGGTATPTWYAPTAGSVLFAGTGGILQQDNANLFWDDSNNRLGIGINSGLSDTLHVAGTGKFTSYITVESTASAPIKIYVPRTNGIAIGSSVLASNSSSFGGNTGVGTQAGFAVTSGYNNSLYGFGAGYGITTGHDNVAMGIGAMGTGFISVGTTGITGSFNVAVGYNTLYYEKGSSYNVAIGHTALGGSSLASVSGYNTGIGAGAGSAITTGSYNVVIGNNSGSDIATLDNNVIISDGSGNKKIWFDSSHVPYLNTVANDDTETKLLTWNSSTKDIQYRTVASLPGGAASLTVGTTTISSGTDKRVLFDDAGILGEDGGFTYDKATDALTVAGNIVTPTVYGSTAANGDLILDGTSDSGKTTSYVILQPNGGNVGIGTSSPSERLHLYTSGSGSTTQFRIEQGNSYYTAFYQDWGNSVWYTNSNIYARVNGLYGKTWLYVEPNGAYVNINHDKNNMDFNVKGSTDDNLLYGDASADSLGVGINAPLAKLHLLATTEQLRVGYNGSNYFSTTVDSFGNTVFNAVGTSPEFTFSDPVNVPDDPYDATGWNGNTEIPTKNAIRDKIESMSAGSGITRTIVNTSGSATMGSSASTDYTYFVTGAHTMSLPAAAGNTNRYTVKNTTGSAITVDTAGAENVEGAASVSIAAGLSNDFLSDGTNWWII